MNQDEPEVQAADADRRGRINRLLKSGNQWPVTGAETAEASVLALLEIVDAIDRLTAEIAKGELG